MSGEWALGNVTISGEFYGDVIKFGNRYFLIGKIHYSFYDIFTDPYDTFNLCPTAINWGGMPFEIQDSWTDTINVEISKEEYELYKMRY